MDDSSVTNKKRGRPEVGITQDRLFAYHLCIDKWINDGRLMRWLKNPKDLIDAQSDFHSKVRASDDQQALNILNDWCQSWLSESGWRRLQGNVRQKAYVKGSWEQGREKMRTLQIPTSTHRQLSRFAQEQKLTINQAIKYLLQLSTEEQS